MAEEEAKVPRTRLCVGNGFVCDAGHKVTPPILIEPLQVDYPTDDDSDDGGAFNIKVSFVF